MIKAVSLNCKLIKKEFIRELKIRNKGDPFLTFEAPSLIHAEGIQTHEWSSIGLLEEINSFNVRRNTGK